MPQQRPGENAESHGHGALSLSARQLEVLGLLASGRTNQQIADELGLSLFTVNRHVSNIYRRIGAKNRSDAVGYAFRNGLAE